MHTVAIVGAGPAGLVAGKVLLKDGFDVTIFESRTTLGGVWSYEGSYYNLRTQQPGGTIEFSDLYDGEEFAPWEHVYRYLCNYADKFDLSARIRLRTRVLSISKVNLHDADEPWSIEVEQTNEASSTSIESLKFDFVVVASGLFSRPLKAGFRGEEKFAGSIVHADEIKTREQLLGKNILVVGGGKSAIDMAVTAATINNRCEMIFRRIYVILPLKMLRGRLSIRYKFTRCMCFWSTPYPLAPHGWLFRFIHRHFQPLCDRVRKLITSDLAISNGPDLYNDGVFKPREDGLIAFPVSPMFATLKRENRIQGHLGYIEEIVDSHSIRLDNGKVFSPVDTIVCCTGYSVRFPFFSESDARAMGLPHRTSVDLDLYRRIIPVSVPKIAFLGFFSSNGNWMIDEVASHWISDYFKGVQRLPAKEDMQKEVQTIRQFIRTRFGVTVPYMRQYWLELVEIYLRDMGLPLQRTNNCWTENFGVYRPSRLKTLHEERRARDRGLPIPTEFYFSFLHFLLVLCGVCYVVYVGFLSVTHDYHY